MTFLALGCTLRTFLSDRPSSLQAGQLFPDPLHSAHGLGDEQRGLTLAEINGPTLETFTITTDCYSGLSLIFLPFNTILIHLNTKIIHIIV